MWTRSVNYPLALVLLVGPILFFACGNKQKQADSALIALLPREQLPGQLSAAAKTDIYRDVDLYKYIDGGADLYLECGFEEVAAGEYTTRSGESIFANLYRMADPDAAFGIFSLTRRVDFRPYAAGTMGARNDYQIVFCKGVYFIDLQTTSSDSAISRDMEEICRRIDQGIQAPRDFPDVLRLLPRPGFIPHSEVYVRGPLGLNSRHFVADQNIYALNDSTPAALAYYHLREGGHPALIMVVAYPDSVEARRVFGALESHYESKAQPDDSASAVFKKLPTRLTYSSNGELEVVIRRGTILSTVFDVIPLEDPGSAPSADSSSPGK